MVICKMIVREKNSCNIFICKIVTSNKVLCKIIIQGVTGGTDQTSGECSLGQTIPI